MSRSLGDTAPGRIFRYLCEHEGRWVSNVEIVRNVFGGYCIAPSTQISHMRAALPSEWELVSERKDFDDKQIHWYKLTRRAKVEDNGQGLLV